MPIYLSPRPIAATRLAISRFDPCMVLFWAVFIGLAIVTGVLVDMLGDEMAEYSRTVAEVCADMGPNDLPQCVALRNN